MSRANEEGNLFKKLWPHFAFQRYSGFLFFEILNNGEIVFTRKAKVHLIVASCIQIVLAAEICKFYAKSSGIYLEVASVLEKLMCILFTIFDIAYYLMHNVLSKLNNKRKLRILTQFAKIEEELQEFGISIKFTLQPLLQYQLLAYGCILLNHDLSFFYVDYTVVDNIASSLYETFLIFFVCLAQIAFILDFFNTNFIMRDILKSINISFAKKCSKVRGIGTPNKIDSEVIAYVDEIKKISEVLQNTFNLLKAFNEEMSIRSVLLLGMFFNWLTIHVFNFAMVIAASGFAPQYNLMTFFSVGSMLYSILHFGSFILSAELFYKEVRALKKVLFKVANSFNNEQIRKEINLLTLAISHENYEITAAGFFVIDVKLLLTIIAAIIMYTIILTQFNPDAGVFHEYMHNHLL